jgi:hypothetical protein
MDLHSRIKLHQEIRKANISKAFSASQPVERKEENPFEEFHKSLDSEEIEKASKWKLGDVDPKHPNYFVASFNAKGQPVWKSKNKLKDHPHHPDKKTTNQPIVNLFTSSGAVNEVLNQFANFIHNRKSMDESTEKKFVDKLTSLQGTTNSPMSLLQQRIDNSEVDYKKLPTSRGIIQEMKDAINKHYNSQPTSTAKQPSEDKPKQTKTKLSKEASIPKSNKHGFEDYDHKAYVQNKIDRRSLYESLENDYNKANPKDKVWSHKRIKQDSQKASQAYQDIISKVDAKYPPIPQPKLSLGLNQIQFVLNTDDSSLKWSKEYDKKTKLVAELLHQPQVEPIIKSIDKVVSDFKNSYSGNSVSESIYAKITAQAERFTDTTESPDGKHGIVNISFYIGDYGRYNAKFLVAPGTIILMNEDSLIEQATDNQRSATLINGLLKAVKGANSPVAKGKVFTDKDKSDAVRLINFNMPASDKVSTYQGHQVDKDLRKVTLFVRTAREARHPSDYGSAGKSAEKLMQQWQDKVQNDVVKPLEQAGWRVSMQAK